MNIQPDLFVEFDLLETCKNKAMIIRASSQLASVVYGDSPFDAASTSPEIVTSRYILKPMDLTDCASLEAYIKDSPLSCSAPTLFLSECVLIYINPDLVNPSLQCLQKAFPNSVMVVYEQIRPNDPFGAMMIQNLHVELESASHRRSAAAICWAWRATRSSKTRSSAISRWDTRKCFARTCSISTITSSTRASSSGGLCRGEVRRSVSRLELFDEFEEWYLIQSHYCLLVAAQGSLAESFDRLVKPSQSLVFSNKHSNCLQTRSGRSCAATSSSSRLRRECGASHSPAPRAQLYCPDSPSSRLPSLPPPQGAFRTCSSPSHGDRAPSHCPAASPAPLCTTWER